MILPDYTSVEATGIFQLDMFDYKRVIQLLISWLCM